jgi:hypothetical protein
MGGKAARASRAFGTAAIAAGLAFIGWLALGGLDAAASLLAGFLLAAWRHDNDLGTCFPLALLVVITILIMVVLMTMLGMIWAANH